MKTKIIIFVGILINITFCVTLLSFTTETMPYPSKTQYFKWDHQFYIRMAKDKMNLKKTHCENPYCYRVVIPAIVSVFPQEHYLLMFKIISFVGIYLTALSLFYFLRVLKFSRFMSFIGLNFYLFSRFGPKFIMFDNFRPESLAIFFILCGFIFLLKRKHVLFAVFFTLAILTKEQPISLILVYYVYHCRKLIDRRAIKKTLIVGAVPLLIFFFLRIYFPSVNPNYPFYHYVYRRIIEDHGLTVIFSLINTLGIVFYIILFHPGNCLKNLCKKKYFLVYFIFQIIILFSAGDDLERFVMYLWPVVIPLALWNINANRQLYLKLAFLLIPMQIYLSKIYKFYTLDGKPTFLNEQHYVNNFAVWMNRDIFAQDLQKMIILGLILFAAAKILSRKNKLPV